MRRILPCFTGKTAAHILRACDILAEARKRKQKVMGYGAGQFAKKLADSPAFRAVASNASFLGFFDDMPGRTKSLRGFRVYRNVEHLINAHIVLLCTDTPEFVNRMRDNLQHRKFEGLVEGLSLISENPGIEVMRCQKMLDQQTKLSKTDRLHLGCGANLIPGWINADWLEPSSVPPGAIDRVNDVYIMDATKPFPFVDNQFEYMFCEDFIEHFDQCQGLHIVAESARTLRPGGVWRISTPSFDEILETQELKRGAVGVKKGSWGWGHKLLYSYDALVALLKQAGFTNIQSQRSGYSRYNILRNIDTRGHQKNIILDAVKRKN